MATKITGASLDPILTRLNGVDNYHPLEADTFSDWSIEAGDIVTVSRGNENYKSPVHVASLEWKGTTPQVQISSTGKQERDPVAVASRKKYGRGSSGLLSNQRTYQDIITSYNNMTAGLVLASSSAALYVENAYTQMKAGLNLASSNASLYVDNKYNQMKAGLDLTSSTAHLYVRNSYAQMQSGLALASSSAALYVQNRTTRAYIMTRINADGEGEALIEADKVSITGSTTINGVLKVEDDALIVKKNAIFQGNILLQTSGSQLKIGSGTSIQFLGTSAYSVDNASIGTAIKDASVSGTTLTLTRFNGQTVTFNKAATPTLSGSWSSGTLTVTSNPAAAENYVRTLSQGTTSWSSNTAYVPINVTYGSSGQYSESTGWRVSVNASSIYTNGYNAGAPSSMRLGSKYSNTTWNFTITKGDGTTVTKTADCSSIYTDARSGYSQNPLSLGGSWTDNRTYSYTIKANGTNTPYTGTITGPWFFYTSTAAANNYMLSRSNGPYLKIGLSKNDSPWSNTTWEIPSASHSISITPDAVGKSDDPGSSYTELWSTTNFIRNKWYVMTVSCGGTSKKYKIHITQS